jgi:uncharacterized protein
MRPLKPRSISVIAACAGVLLAAPVMAQTVPPAMISVTGEATISVAPDQAAIEAGATSDAKTAREASEANNTATGQLLLALKAADIDAKDIQTSRLSLQPQYPQNTSNLSPPTVSGYRASNHVTVRLHDITKVASTIDLLVGAGATDIVGINFTVSQASKLLDDAREKAVDDARRKAEIYAKAAGVTLGAPLSISEGGLPQTFHFGGAATIGMAARVPVEPGEEKLSVTVSVSWAIKQAGQ